MNVDGSAVESSATVRSASRVSARDENESQTSSRLRGWLNSTAESVVDESEGALGSGAQSVYGDDIVDVKEYVAMNLAKIDEDVSEEKQTVEQALTEVAHSEQRMITATCRFKYVRGRVHVDYDDLDPILVPQKMSIFSNYTQLDSLDDKVFFERVARGKLYTRLGAATGIGKTHKLPGLIASRCNLRVCLLVPDANVAKQAMRSAKSNYCVSVSNRRWRRDRVAFVGAFSYEDFMGIMRSGLKSRMFKDFDVFMLDEAHRPLSDTYAAKNSLVTFATSENSVIWMSATASSDASNDVVASRVGAFINEPVPGGFDALLDSGRLVGQYLSDQTAVIVSSNRKVSEVCEYYKEHAVDVRVLDTGSSSGDETRVNEWMSGDSMTPRVVVMHEAYGLAHNIITKYVITSATRLVYVADNKGGLVEKEIPIREVEVKQHQGRTGRGMTVGSGGIIASNDRDTGTSDLLKCEYLRAYLLLVAAGVKPNSMIQAEVESLLPRGVTREMASMLLSIELPPALVLRYLGSDGRIAGRFVSAMKLYLQPDFILIPSCDMDPVGYNSWVTEKVGAYYQGDESATDVDVYVPFASPESLKVVMHTLYAVSQAWIHVEYWRPEDFEDSPSDDEDLGTRALVKRKKRVAPLRTVPDEYKALPPVPVVEQGWSYDVPQDQLARRNKRSAMSWLGDRDAHVAIESLKQRAERGGSFGSVTADIIRSEDEDYSTVVKVKQGRMQVDVTSPGGTVFLKIQELLYEELVNGKPLTPGYTIDLMQVVRQTREAFVKSTLFDNFSNVWVSVLRTMSDTSCVKHVRNSGFGTDLSFLFSKLYDRFRSEVFAVCSTSNLYKDSLSTFLQTNDLSLRRLNKFIKRGKMPIAQSDRFISRIKELFEKFTIANKAMESQGLFNPDTVTSMQKSMPIQTRGRMPVEGEDLFNSASDTGWREF